MKTLEKQNISMDDFADEECTQINEQLTKAITSKKRIPVDEKFWQERRANLDEHVKESGK